MAVKCAVKAIVDVQQRDNKIEWEFEGQSNISISKIFLAAFMVIYRLSVNYIAHYIAHNLLIFM